MFFKDNSKYSYSINKELQNVENIGWLSKENDFHSGNTTSRFKEKLLDIILHKNCNKMRGIHACDICCKSNGMLFVNSNGIIPKLAELSDFNKNEVLLGHSEIWIPSVHSNIIYASPTLIYHYVIEHNYLPPLDYIESILSFDLDSEWDGDKIIDFLLKFSLQS